MSTALAILNVSKTLEKFPILDPKSEANQLIRENMAGEPINPNDLVRVKVPSGGGTIWQVQTAAGVQALESMEGVIIAVARRRAYWEDPNPTGAQPDCSSSDCVIGVGNPGGECASCPLNEFGTATKQDGSQGRGKACKETALAFVLREGKNLPDVVVIPPGSLKSFRQYRLQLEVPFYSAITRLTLTATTNKDGIKYAQAVPRMIGQLDKESAARVQALAAMLKGTFDSATIDASDVNGDG